MTNPSSPLSLREQIERLARALVYRYAAGRERDITSEDEDALIAAVSAHGNDVARLTLDAVEAEIEERSAELARAIRSLSSEYPRGAYAETQRTQACVNKLRAQLTGSLHSAPPGYNIGPFRIDEAESTITIAPGVYELTVPITFGKLPDTKVEGVTFRMPLPSPPAEPTP